MGANVTLGDETLVLTFQGRDLLDAAEEMNRVLVEHNWSDGFPPVPPTFNRVEKMLNGTDRVASEVASPGGVILGAAPHEIRHALSDDYGGQVGVGSDAVWHDRGISHASNRATTASPLMEARFPRSPGSACARSATWTERRIRMCGV